MARIKNANFIGAPPRTVVADASITRTWLLNAVGDTALVSDKCTGENSETPITHTGAGDGCPLRLPLAAQHLDRSLILSGTAVPEDDFYILAVPVFVPAGEAGQFRLTVTTKTPAGVDVTAQVWDSAGNVDWGPYPGTITDLGDESPGARNVSRLSSFIWSVTLGAGLQYILVKRPCFFADEDPDGRLISWTLDHDRTYAGEANGLTAGNGGTAIGDPYKTNATTFTPANDHDTYDEEVTAAGPLSAYVLTRLNRQINALWERITGALIPGNATYQTTTTWDNNRASFTAEGLLDFPMTIAALGACHGDTGKPSIDPYDSTSPTDGLLYWAVHPISRSMTWDNLYHFYVTCPSFRTSSSDLKCAVLIHTTGAASTAANWRFRINNITAGLAATGVAAVQIGTSRLLVATITGVPFTASADNLMLLQISNTATGAGVTGEVIDVLGAALYFDP
jgi:hypothetical protein